MCARPGFFPRPFFGRPNGRQGELYMSASEPSAKQYRPETRLVQSGILRSQFAEPPEALFLHQGHGYQYSRFANPTVDMFERRIAAFEGAEAARALSTGMAAVTLSIFGQVKA